MALGPFMILCLHHLILLPMAPPPNTPTPVIGVPTYEFGGLKHLVHSSGPVVNYNHSLC
jgi:hypothetical protein